MKRLNIAFGTILLVLACFSLTAHAQTNLPVFGSGSICQCNAPSLRSSDRDLLEHSNGNRSCYRAGRNHRHSPDLSPWTTCPPSFLRAPYWDANDYNKLWFDLLVR
jgi:hypothetical protein